MAGEIQVPYGISGKNIYTIVRNSIGQVWNGTTFVSYNGSNFTDYDVLLTENGSSGTYIGDMPVGISSAGIYTIEARERISGSPAQSDPVIAAGNIEWTGTAISYQSSTATDVMATFNASYSDEMARLDANISSRAVAGDAMTLTSTERGNVADKLLGRNLGGGSDGGRMVKDALRPNRNKVEFDIPSAGKFTVYAEDDSTIAWIGDYTRGPNNLGPLVGTDPA